MCEGNKCRHDPKVDGGVELDRAESRKRAAAVEEIDILHGGGGRVVFFIGQERRRGWMRYGLCERSVTIIKESIVNVTIRCRHGAYIAFELAIIAVVDG